MANKRKEKAVGESPKKVTAKDLNLKGPSMPKFPHGNTYVKIPKHVLVNVLNQGLGGHFHKYIAAAEKAVDEILQAKDRLYGTAAFAKALYLMYKHLRESGTPDYMRSRFKNIILSIVYALKTYDE